MFESSSPGASRLVSYALLAMICGTLAFAGCGESKPGNANVANRNSGAGLSGQGSPVVCDNTYFPVRTGASWEYSSTYRGGKGNTISFSETHSNVALGSFNQHQEYSDGVKSDITWNCTTDGLTSSQFGNIGLERNPSSFKFEIIRTSGATVPLAGRWDVGYRWNTSYEVKGKRTEPGSSVEAEAEGTIEISNEIKPREKISVPAGTFDSFLVDSIIRERLTVRTGSPLAAPLIVSIKTSAWYAENVGLVKISFSGDPGTGTDELVSFRQ